MLCLNVGDEQRRIKWGRGGAATPQYEKWEGEHMFSPPNNCIKNIYNYSLLSLNPTSSPIFK